MTGRTAMLVALGFVAGYLVSRHLGGAVPGAFEGLVHVGDELAEAAEEVFYKVPGARETLDGFRAAIGGAPATATAGTGGKPCSCG